MNVHVYVTAVTADEKYCYQEAVCLGTKYDNELGVMTKDECCTGRSNSGWGLAGVSCEPCTPFEGTSNVTDYNITLPTR